MSRTSVLHQLLDQRPSLRPLRGLVFAVALGTGLCCCSASDPANGNGADDGGDEPAADTSPSTPAYSYEIVNVVPHDPAASTQGLVYVDGFLYEGTGQYGRSWLRKVELSTGEVLQEHALESQFFGEGIVIFGDLIIQLTYRSKFGFVYDRDTFEEVGRVSYPTEGWGLTWDGERLIMSDGSPNLYFRDPQTFEEIGRLAVHYSVPRSTDVSESTDVSQSTDFSQSTDSRPLDDLNELEFVNGEVFANIWQTDLIARISPETGQVVGWIDLRGLLTSGESRLAGVLNGIAYDSAGDRLFVTGKLWPWVFEIELTGPVR